MIRLGLRLAVTGGREALTRLAAIAVAVALGVGLLLTTLAGMNAVDAQLHRYTWLSTGQSATAASSADAVWWSTRWDRVDGNMINRIDVAAAGPHAPVPPGLPRLPGPGEWYASPQLRTLIATMPAGQLGDRFPGEPAGTIGPGALASPRSLTIVVGRTAEEMSRIEGARRVDHIATTPPDRIAQALTLVLAVVAAGLLFPLIIFVSTATRLSAARREQRYAAMRLVGSTPGQIAVFSAVESTIGAGAGTLAGFAVYLALRGPVLAIPFTGETFFPADLTLTLPDMLLVLLGVPAGAALAGWVALRRVRISPLGVSRRVTPRPPRAYRLILLAAGLAELGWFVGRRPHTTDGQAAAYLSGILLVMVGLVVAGPWLTMTGARLVSARSGRPGVLLAARRLADNPHAGFRAVSGLVLALFVTSVAVGVITTIVANRGPHRTGAGANHLVSMSMGSHPDGAPGATSVPAPVLADLTAVAGVSDVVVLRRNPADEDPASLPVLVSCADLARLPQYGRCPAGATVVQTWSGFTGPDDAGGADRVWPVSPLTVDDLRRQPIASIEVRTDGSTAVVERARTALEAAYPQRRFLPDTEADNAADFTRTLVGWQRLADVVIVASLAVAGCSLAVSVAGGLSERRRPFSLLRLTGVPLRVLRQVVALESVVALLLAAVVAIGAGLLAAQLFLRSQMDYTLRPPHAGYYLVVAAGLAVSLGIVASTLPLLARITGPENARND